MSALAGIPADTRFNPESLGDESVRNRVTPATVKAVIRLLEAWRVSGQDSAALMGMPLRTWYQVKSGERDAPLTQDELTRASYLIGTFKGLHLLFDAPLCDEWPTLANAGAPFEGRSPVKMMVDEGISAMMTVRRHVDALRGGL